MMALMMILYRFHLKHKLVALIQLFAVLAIIPDTNMLYTDDRALTLFIAVTLT